MAGVNRETGPSHLFALVFDGDHQLVSLVDQVSGRCEDGVGPGKENKTNILKMKFGILFCRPRLFEFQP